MKFKVKIGKEFEISEAVIRAETDQIKENTRKKLALGAAAFSAIALAVALILSLYTWDFSYLSTLWAMIAAPISLIIGHYFGRGNSNDKEDHNSGSA